MPKNFRKIGKSIILPLSSIIFGCSATVLWLVTLIRAGVTIRFIIKHINLDVITFIIIPTVGLIGMTIIATILFVQIIRKGRIL